MAVGSEGADRLDRETSKALMCFFDCCSQFLVCQDCVSRNPRALDDRPTANFSGTLSTSSHSDQSTVTIFSTVSIMLASGRRRGNRLLGIRSGTE